MNYLKSLVEPIFNSKTGVLLRNTVGFKRTEYAMPTNIENYSCSDLFFWRTGQNFRTVFRFSDIPNAYYGIENSQVLLVFYNKHGKELFREILSVNDAVTEIEIDKNKIGKSEDYGTFSIFHLFDPGKMNDIKITNRCYVGYQFKNSLPSFVHGNVLAQYLDLSVGNDYIINNDVAKVFRNPSHYIIQKNFNLFDYSELMFCNPSEKNIWIEVNEKKIELLPKSSALIKIDHPELLKIKSNLPMPRPVVFSFKNKFFDCHHG